MATNLVDVGSNFVVAALAGRQPLPSLHPLDESGFEISDGSADLDEGRPVTTHPRLGEPGQADLQKPRGFLRGKQHRGRKRLRRRRAPSENRIRHNIGPFQIGVHAPCGGMTRTAGPSQAK